MRAHRMQAVAILLLAISAALAGGACGGGPPAEPKEPAPAPLPTTTDEPTAMDESGFIDVSSSQPTEIKIDGKSVGTTPIEGYKVPPGTHEVTFMFPEPATQTVTVEPGKTGKVKMDPIPKIQESAKEEPAKKK